MYVQIQNAKFPEVIFSYGKMVTSCDLILEIPTFFKNKIICGDSAQILKLFPSRLADLVLTSPPYNFDRDYSDYDDNLDWNKYYQKLFVIFFECNRILKSGGRMIINIQPSYRNFEPTHHKITRMMTSLKLIWKGEILWNKHNFNCPNATLGSWKSPSSPYLKYDFEFLEIFCKDSIKHEGEKSKIDITESEFKRWVIGNWTISSESRMKEFNHPAMFPEELVRRCLKLFTYIDDFVIDPFNGAGTTTKVCKEFYRHYCGIEISKEYCETAKKRVASFSAPRFIPLVLK